MIDDFLKRYIYIPVGMPCCGKTTFYNTIKNLEEFTPVQIASPDIVREREYPGYEAGTVPFESIDQYCVFLKAHREMEDFLLNGYSVWFDAMNCHIKSRKVIFHRAEAVSYEPSFFGIMNYIVINMTVPLEEILQRNDKIRAGHRKPPEDRLRSMYDFIINIPFEDLMLPERCEIWDLEWNQTWRAKNKVPEKCLKVLDIINGTKNET